MKPRSGRRIGAVAGALGVSADTLRYYEKIALVPAAARDIAGRRVYFENDIARLQFVRHAQKMNFSLAEIGVLLEVRARPGRARREALSLARRKLAEVDATLEHWLALRESLAAMVGRCAGGGVALCPIIECIERGLGNDKA